MTPERWQRLENVGLAIAVVVATIAADIQWWWLLALFLVFDVSALGYATGRPEIGALGYNAVHNYLGPGLLLTGFVWSDLRWMAVVGLAWAFHVAVDRALGYGLKFNDRFGHTHLGQIGGVES